MMKKYHVVATTVANVRRKVVRNCQGQIFMILISIELAWGKQQPQRRCGGPSASLYLSINPTEWELYINQTLL